MTPDAILEKLARNPVIEIGENALDVLLKTAKVLSETDTFMNAPIRILEWRGAILIQEYSDKKEALLRRSASVEEARRFVDDRLEVYERMWDGCGCKIKYYE